MKGIQSYNEINSSFIEKSLKNKNIVYCKYYVSHDGYDRHGPKSNLYDCHIIIRENDEYIFYDFHKEELYGNREEDFDLWKMQSLSKLTKDDFNSFPIINSECDPDLKKAYDEIRLSLFQRLPVGLVPDAEPLDLLQADGACKRLPPTP